MKRTPIAHVVFPRPVAARPVREVVWDAVRAVAQSRALEMEVLIPVPARAARKLAGASRALRGAAHWPEEFEAVLGALEPRPTIIPFPPIPFRSVEAAAATVAATLIARRRAQRPALLQGAFLDEAGYIAAEAARALGVPSIASAHGTDVRVARGLEREAAALGGVSPPAGAIASYSASGKGRRAKTTLAHASRILAVSHELRSEIGLLGRSAHVVRYTADAERFPLRSAAQSGPPVLLFVGRLSRMKGLDLLLDAFSRLENKAIRLRLIGPSAPELDLPVLARSLGVEDRVEIVGELPQPQIAAHYQTASLLVHPSRSEGLPCVLVEALLSGCPVVATDVGGINELISPETGALVEPDNAEALAQAIRRALEGQWSPASLRQRALPFSWQESGPALIAHTLELIGVTEDEA